MRFVNVKCYYKVICPDRQGGNFVYVKCYYKLICPDRQGGNLLYVYYYNSISYLVRCEKNN